MKLTDIYDDRELTDESEALSSAVFEEHLDFDFTVQELVVGRLGSMLTVMGDMTVEEAMSSFATDEQIDLIDEMAADFDHTRVILVDGQCVIDGNHHLMAAIKAGEPVLYIDLADVPILELSSSPT